MIDNAHSESSNVSNVNPLRSAAAQHDLQYEPDPEYRQTEDDQPEQPLRPARGTGELQLVLDPDFL